MDTFSTVKPQEILGNKLKLLLFLTKTHVLYMILLSVQLQITVQCFFINCDTIDIIPYHTTTKNKTCDKRNSISVVYQNEIMMDKYILSNFNTVFLFTLSFFKKINVLIYISVTNHFEAFLFSF